MLQQEPPTFPELTRPRPWQVMHTKAGYNLVDAQGVLVALNLSLRDASLIAAASGEDTDDDD